MTPADHALVQNILDDPLNDGIEGPRGVYADWLDELGHGDDRERAEFIRLQCRIAEIQRDCVCGACVKLRGGGQHHNGPCGVARERTVQTDGSSRQAHLRKHEREFFDAHKTRWFGDRLAILYLDGDDYTAGQYHDLTKTLVRRGFPSSISCTLATLFGGECGRCHGRRDWFDALTGLGQCLDCNGDGRTEGIARDVFSRWPLTRIDLSCRQPIEHDSDRWGWFKHVATMDEATLPAEIWNLMTGFNNYGGYPYAIKWYPTRESAHAALSRAAVNLGRERAGLRPIAWRDA